MYLAGLHDDYEHDGRVITQILTHPDGALSARGVTALGECYKQLNSSVGEFGTATSRRRPRPSRARAAGDRVYTHHGQDSGQASSIVRDRLAGQIKGELEAAAFRNTPIPRVQVQAQTAACTLLTGRAAQLAQHVS